MTRMRHPAQDKGRTDKPVAASPVARRTLEEVGRTLCPVLRFVALAARRYGDISNCNAIVIPFFVASSTNPIHARCADSSSPEGKLCLLQAAGIAQRRHLHGQACGIVGFDGQTAERGLALGRAHALDRQFAQEAL